MKEEEYEKDPLAVELGRRGAAKRNENMSASKRSAQARKAAKARWGKRNKSRKK